MVATLELTVDPSRVGSFDVQAGFQPYTRVRPVEVERVEAGDALLVRYSYALQCLDRACVGRVPDERVFRFRNAIVRYESPTVGMSILPVEWPELTVSSRLAPGAAEEPAFQVAAAPAASYGISPTLLGWLLYGGAAALALGTGVAVFLRLRGGRGPERVPSGAEDELDPLEAALRAVSDARSAGVEERRAALDALARALAAEGRPEVAVVRRTAWSREAPEIAELDRLVAAIRERAENGDA